MWSAKLIILDTMDEKNLAMTTVSDFYKLTSYRAQGVGLYSAGAAYDEN